MRTRILVLFLLASGCAFASERPQVVSHIPRASIQSTALRSIGYSRRRHILEIEFVNGAIYRYYDVGPFVYRELINADSKARYYDFNIRRKYLSARVKQQANDRTQD